jgi:hypothetical protein
MGTRQVFHRVLIFNHRQDKEFRSALCSLLNANEKTAIGSPRARVTVALTWRNYVLRFLAVCSLLVDLLRMPALVRTERNLAAIGRPHRQPIHSVSLRKCKPRPRIPNQVVDPNVAGGLMWVEDRRPYGSPRGCGFRPREDTP